MHGSMVTPRLDVYTCHICKRLWASMPLLDGEVRLQNMVYTTHPPGTCWHDGEVELTEKKLETMLVDLGLLSRVNI